MLDDLATATTMALGRSRLAMLVVKALNSRMRYLYLQKTEEKRRDHGLMESPKWCSPPRERSSSYQAWSEKMTMKASGWSKLMRNAEGDIRRAEPQHRVCRDND